MWGETCLNAHYLLQPSVGGIVNWCIVWYYITLLSLFLKCWVQARAIECFDFDWNLQPSAGKQFFFMIGMGVKEDWQMFGLISRCLKQVPQCKPDLLYSTAALPLFFSITADSQMVVFKPASINAPSHITASGVFHPLPASAVHTWPYIYSSSQNIGSSPSSPVKLITRENVNVTNISMYVCMYVTVQG